MSRHIKTQIFTLVGRHIVLHEPYAGCIRGTIIKQMGKARFECLLWTPTKKILTHRKENRPVSLILHRGDFILPPLPRSDRWPVFLPDDSDGFTYADQPDF